MNFFDVTITEQAKKNVQEVLDSGFVNEGEWVERFEKEISTRFGYKNCVAVNSCTSALHLALLLAGVEGGEVILPAQTFVATGLAVLYCRAKPVFADIDKNTGNIDPKDVLKKINANTRAVIAVSWGGNPAWVSVLQTICEHNNICFIQDNAQALGATFLGRPLTEWGNFSCYSFQAIKHVTSGDGGMLCCSEWHTYESAKECRWFNISKENELPDDTGERKYNLHYVGYKYNMNNISAALGLGNLEGFEDRQKTRNKIADIYNRNLPQRIRTMTRVGRHAYWLYDILVDNRSRVMEKLRENDIPCSVVHVGIDRNDVFGGYQDLPNQRYWDEHHLCLPINSSMTEEDACKVVDVVKGNV